MMERATLWLDKTTKDAAGRVVAYRRGGKSIDKLSVTPGQTEWDAFGTEAGASARTVDAVALVADLAFEGEGLFLPERGDEVDWIDAKGKLHTFVVLPRGDDLPYRYTDPTELRVRIFMVKTLANPEPQQ